MGQTLIDNVWRPALIILQPNLNFHIYLPGIYRDEESPKSIEGQVGGWELSIVDGPSSVSFSPISSISVSETMKLKEEEIDALFSDSDSKIWTEITFVPNTCIFSKIASPTNIPDEWGITFYPEENNRILFHLFGGDRNPRLLRSNIFSIADRSLYFSNSEKWNFTAIRERLKLIASCLSFFTGAPVSYELLVGKYKKEILFVQFKNESNPNAYVCPSPYNARIAVAETCRSTFSSDLVKSVEKIFTEFKQHRIEILLSYFGMLYMANYDETKIAFSFQLMEALAKYKGLQFGETYKNKILKKLSKKMFGKMCSTCSSLLQKEIRSNEDAFKDYVDRALNVLKANEYFLIDAVIMKKIAKKYRNEIFHGGFFGKMVTVENLVKTLPESYQRDLPLVFQAIVSMIGVHFILGIDFKEMVALKRTMYE